ncbi:MAG TPA: hypothetical protein VGN86_11630 [Pyrinomonadaceae bacterium]|jgi:hypothetical protein|nr:hypothetical protein [Pyrinomonadaceae bacterium]
MSAAAGGAAHAAAIANAIKASGVICKVEPEDFVAIVRKVDKPLVVVAQGGFFSPKTKYLTSYKGLAFYTRSAEPIQFSSDTEIVNAKKISIPD